MKFLTQPLKIKDIMLVNRLVMPPMATSKSVDGVVGQPLIDYYKEKSQGGHIGLIITEHAYIHPQGMASIGQLSIARDSDIDGLRQLVKGIQENGSKVIAQISHAGSATTKDITGYPSVSASAVVNEGGTSRKGELPVVMSLEQIRQVVRDFASAARRAKEAGFDGVEIHSAHGYLLCQFYSPLTNKREDAYTGKTIEGRLRLHKEVIEAIREAVGPDYLVAVRLGGCDYTEGGSTIADSVKAAVLLESYGVDLLDISGGLNGYIIKGNTEPAGFREMTVQIKAKVSVPVILTGGITTGICAEQLLVEGKADLIGVGRAILKDSRWAEKNTHNSICG